MMASASASSSRAWLAVPDATFTTSAWARAVSAEADEHREADAHDLLDLAMDAEPRHRAAQGHRNDDAFQGEGDQRR